MEVYLTVMGVLASILLALWIMFGLVDGIAKLVKTVKRVDRLYSYNSYDRAVKQARVDLLSDRIELIFERLEDIQANKQDKRKKLCKK